MASPHLIGNGCPVEAQDDAVVGVARLLTSGLASGPLTILFYEHFRL